jgi:hypothetical protein
LITDFAGRSARVTDKLAIFLASESHGSFDKVHAYGDCRSSHLIDKAIEFFLKCQFMGQFENVEIIAVPS